MKYAPVMQEATIMEQSREPVGQTCEESGYTNRALAGGSIDPKRCQPPHALHRAGGANSRLHPRFGFVNPILVAADGGIIAGEGRLRAARTQGSPLFLPRA